MSSACSTARGFRSKNWRSGAAQVENPRKVWRIFASHYYLFRGTPTRLVARLRFPGTVRHHRAPERIRTPTCITTPSRRSWPRRSSCRARCSSDSTSRCWPRPTPRSTRSRTMRRFANRGGRDASFRRSGPMRGGSRNSPASSITCASLGALTGENTTTWRGYLRALEKRRAFFKSMGGTATDHGHPTAVTEDLSETARPPCSTR